MYLVFDIGGTHSRFALSEDGKTFDNPKIITTPQDFDEGMRMFNEVYMDMTRKKEVKKVAGGIAGVFNRERTELLRSPHLQNWVGNPIKKRINEITGVESHFDNDTAIVGLGEAYEGAGKGYPIVAYITISTGVGGARIIDGKLDVSTYNFEPGHQIIDADGTICPECLASEDGESKGHWESMISGTSVKERTGKDPKDIQDESFWDDIARYIAYGLNNTIVHWTPDIVVLGGGMMRTSQISTEKISMHLKNILKIYPIHPEIRKAELGDYGGLHGALAYIRQYE